MGKPFSRRDLLQLGGKLAMTVGGAKLLVTLPGCEGGKGNGPTDPMLDDCHSLGTYDYVVTSTYYTYHYYFTSSFGCPDYIYLPNVHCYPDYSDFAPGYDYFCFSGYYHSAT